MFALIVDDSQANRLILQIFLREAGFETAGAENGPDALWHLHRIGKVDLIIADFKMPGMNGVEFVRAVRSLSQYSGVPVIMVTSDHRPELADAAFGAGVNELLIKPFTREILLETFGSLGFNRELATSA